MVSPGAFINGLEVNGSTSRDEGYFNAPIAVSSAVDLDKSIIRGRVERLGGGPPQCRFSGQVTFKNGAAAPEAGAPRAGPW
ncbi:MAG: hypothetical protein BroJett010_02680 [Gammaproteobacteria bacterium]|nr:MAG: hypothetical protein BroJett010_02680 [Gammaproteobacteria bacterium]